MDAHSLEELRKEMLMCESVARSWVFPEWVLVWKRRSMPPFSCLLSACYLRAWSKDEREVVR